MGFFAFEALSVTNTSVALTAATYLGATHAHIYCDIAAVRVRFDGTAPTTTVGLAVEVGDELYLDELYEISNFRAIREGGTSATLQVHYGYGE
mgnify:CR=1 FL=1